MTLRSFAGFSPLHQRLRHAFRRREARSAAPLAAEIGAGASKNGSALEVVVARESFVPAGVADVFDFVAGEDVLPQVLTGYGLVPAVVSTSNVSGPWNRPGSSRTVHLADGNTAHEKVTDYTRPSYFAYRVTEPTFSLRLLMVGAQGQWWFAPTRGGTNVRWTYTFRARGLLAKWPLALFAHTQWAGYMDVCLKNVGRHFHSSTFPPG